MVTDNIKKKSILSQKPDIGSQISDIWNDIHPIACWQTEDKKSWFTKILYSPEKKLWYPVTNPRYRSKGLVVFLSSKIEDKNDFIEITDHGKNCVFADVLYY